MKKILATILLFFLSASPAFAAFSCSRPITIDKTKVGGTAVTPTNFPVLFDETNTSFATVANGGKIQNANGYDVQLFSDSSLTTRIPAEREPVYNATTGRFTAWYKVPTLSTTTNSVYYIGYGDSSISTDPNLDGTYGATSVWNSSFKRVYHLPNGTSLTASDSTSAGANGTLVNTPTAVSGKIDGAAAFVSASTQKITFSDTGLPSGGSDHTQSIWVYMTASPTGNPVIFTWGSASASAMSALIMTGTTPNIHARYAIFGSSVTGTVNMSTNTWYKIDVVQNLTTGIVYVNGVLDASGGSSPNIVLSQGVLGARQDSTLYFDGYLDEARISDSVRSQDWITTDYNSAATSTFYTLGSETCTSSAAPLSRHIFSIGKSFRAFIGRGFQLLVN